MAARHTKLNTFSVDSKLTWPSGDSYV